MHWYSIHTTPGRENNVKAALVQVFTAAGNQLGEIVIIPAAGIEPGNRKQLSSTNNIVRGSMFLRMEMTKPTYDLVTGTPHVIEFIGKSRPMEFKELEVRQLLDWTTHPDSDPFSVTRFSVGDRVRIIDGPFEGFSGELIEVNIELATVKVIVIIFGRPTPVELSGSQIESSGA
jgi:transcriptional antiterminator NusG